MAYDLDLLCLSFTLPPSSSGGPTVIILTFILFAILFPGIARFLFPKILNEFKPPTLQ